MEFKNSTITIDSEIGEETSHEIVITDEERAAIRNMSKAEAIQYLRERAARAQAETPFDFQEGVVFVFQEDLECIEGILSPRELLAIPDAAHDVDLAKSAQRALTEFHKKYPTIGLKEGNL